MKERVAALVGPVAHRMWVSTFHSACARILRREAPVLGYRSSFSIYDQADAVRLADYVRRDLNLDPKRFPPRRLHARDLGAEERARRRRARPSTAPFTPPEKRRRGVPRVPAPAARGVGHSTSTTCSCSTVRLFREHPDVLARWRHRFQSRARRRVPGHQPRAVGARAHAHRGAPQRDGGRRHRSVDLQVPRGRLPQPACGSRRCSPTRR